MAGKSPKLVKHTSRNLPCWCLQANELPQCQCQQRQRRPCACSGLQNQFSSAVSEPRYRQCAATLSAAAIPTESWRKHLWSSPWQLSARCLPLKKNMLSEIDFKSCQDHNLHLQNRYVAIYENLISRIVARTTAPLPCEFKV